VKKNIFFSGTEEFLEVSPMMRLAAMNALTV
jgi:hypothetical protein